MQPLRRRLEGALVDDRPQGVELIEGESGHELSLCAIENMSWRDVAEARTVDIVHLETTLPIALLGFGTSLALIVAIGAQNAYVLRVGLTRVTRVVVPVVVVCAISDAVLISAGVAGVGALITAVPEVVVVVRLVGAGFLLVYAAFAAVRLLRPECAGSGLRARRCGCGCG